MNQTLLFSILILQYDEFLVAQKEYYLVIDVITLLLAHGRNKKGA